MKAVWNRLEQLAMVHHPDPVVRGDMARLVIVLAPGIPRTAGLIPRGFEASDAPWLTDDVRDLLMLRCGRGAAGEEHSASLDGGREARAVALFVERTHIGMLVALSVADLESPWTASVAQRLADALAVSILPGISAQLEAERSERSGDGLLQLGLERLGTPHPQVGFARGSCELTPSPSFRGEVALLDGTVASYLGRVTGGPCPTTLATVVTCAVRRWLVDVPDPDPATVVDAVRHDLLGILGQLGAAADLTVIVPDSDASVTVATTAAAVVAFGPDGRVLAVVTASGARLDGEVPDPCQSVSFHVPAGGHLVAIDGVDDPQQVVRYSDRAPERRGDAAAAASALMNTIVQEGRERPQTVLVHLLG